MTIDYNSSNYITVIIIIILFKANNHGDFTMF